MPLGGFCPLPLRLGGTAETGFTASQHARAANDLLGLHRMAVLAIISGRIQGSVATILSARCQWGIGPAYFPTIAVISNSHVEITFPIAPTDALGQQHALRIRSVRGGVPGDAPRRCYGRVKPGFPTILDMRIYDQSTATLEDDFFTIMISGDWLPQREIGDYGAALDKEDSTTEGTVPYAWTWYQELGERLGPAFSKQMDTHVHVRKLAYARSEQARTRASERALCNSVPATADETLPKWAKVFNLPVVSDKEDKHLLRQRAAAHFASISGNDGVSIDLAVSELLGDLFLAVVRTRGALLSTPPADTWWPTINPGPADQDLGGGAWSSVRCHLIVHRKRDPETLEERALIDVRLQRMLDDRLPAWATFECFVP